MELTCVLVLVIVGFVTASPHGYGTKGGAAAKADARAVAGAYTSGSVPLSIPSGAGYSGSFSQSSSSSSSSSSASSSSSSFSYNGSGAIGGVIPGATGCGTGNCNAGGAGSQAYSGANAGALAGGYGGTTPTGSYGHKHGSTGSQPSKTEDCGSEGCQTGSGSLDGNNAGTGFQSVSDAKAAASAGAGLSGGSDCGGSGCKNVPSADTKCPSGQCNSNAKCSSGDCSAMSPADYQTQNKESGQKCSSGECGLNQDTEGNSSVDNGTNDIHVPTSGTSNAKSSYGASGSGCTNGNCGSSYTPGSVKASEYSKPSTDLIAPKLEPTCSGSQCRNSPSGYSSNTFKNPTFPENNPPCINGVCGLTSSSEIKAPYTSTNYQNGNQITQTHSGYGGFTKIPTALGGSGTNTPGLTIVPSTTAGAGAQQDTKDNLPVYTGGFGGPAGILKPNEFNAPTSSYGNSPAADKQGALNHGGYLKPSYSHGSSPSGQPSGCTAGTPGCPHSVPPSGPSACASGNCGTNPSSPGYGSPSGVEPSFSIGSSPSYAPGKPSGQGCTPGTPGCDFTAPPSGPSACASGNCGTNPSSPGYGRPSGVKPSYSFGSSPSYSPVKPSGPDCAPGNPGCDITAPPSGPSACASGNCGPNPSSPGYGSPSGAKPSYSFGSSPSYSPVKPSEPDCAPGTPSCYIPAPPSGPSACVSGNCGTNPSAPGFGSPSGAKPSYSFGSSPWHSSVKPSGQGCAPGTLGCGIPPPSSGPLACVSGNCGTNPSAPGFGSPTGVKPSYSFGSSPSYSPVKPSGQGCAPGTPGCYIPAPPSGPSGCASGNCGTSPSAPGYAGSSSLKPTYSHESSPSLSPVNPSRPSCTPGSPGCTLFPSAYVPSGCTTGNCGAYPSSSGYGTPSGIKPGYSEGSSSSYFPVKPSGLNCVPGTPGCKSTPSPTIPLGCTSGNCGANPTSTGYNGPSSIKPGYSQGTLYSPIKPSGPGCLPGAAGCGSPASGTAPFDCKTGNCGTNSSPLGCSPGTPGCLGSPSAINPGSSGFPSAQPDSGAPSYPGSSSFPTSQTSTGIHRPSYSASGAGTSLIQGSYGSHGTGSIYTSNKPVSNEFTSGSGSYKPGFSSVPAASGAAPVFGSPSNPQKGDTTAGASAHQGTKENSPAYTGGFGGPAGILKPNELTVPPNHGIKPAISTNPSIAKPACTSASGICDAPTVPIHSHSGSASDAQATAEASASANAVAYTGGFGGPPGFLKPYDGGKTDAKGIAGKQLQGSLLNLNQGNGGSGIHSSYSNSGSQTSGSAVAQAVAVSSSTTGVSGGGNNADGSHGGAAGCGGGCGGSGGNLGYSGAIGQSKPAVMGDLSNGLATAGAVAKSVATASSGARAYGGSYASSSASAHAGASVKGGYGRR